MIDRYAVSRDDVAVIGMACRFPGASTPSAFWRILRDGTATIAEPSRDRLTGDETAGPGGYLDSVDQFDAGFFGISPREAGQMDPQQRLMLELAWEGLEDAGITSNRLAGSRTGVFVGAMRDDYAVLVHRRGIAAVGQHTLAGLNRAMMANRVSHFLGLNGPSLAMDTGQSSSLVAVHLALQSLRSGECAVALAGGVNLMLTSHSTAETASFGALSPDGRCHTFDARANGIVRGEGGGLVVLKSLVSALADGDRVYCTIRNSAVNNDGPGRLVVPNVLAQREVLRLACQRAAVEPGEVQYVELHGTGTRVGDPVEAAALGAVLGAAEGRRFPLRVGSVKTNIGHLEGAAGIAGLLKTCLSLSHEEFLPSLNFESPNPEIPLDELRLRVQTHREHWDRLEIPRLAGVSSFGMGGTNCHVVLSDLVVPPAPDLPRATAPPGPVVWVLSAKTADALRAQARALRLHVESRPDLRTEDVAWSLALTREAFAHRAAVLGTADRHESLRGLLALEHGESAPNVIQGAVTEQRREDADGGRRGLDRLAEDHVRGVEVDWPAILAATGGQRIDLPTYAFERRRHWLQDGPEPAALAPESAPHDLLDLVRQEVATVLGYENPQQVNGEFSFEELGVDSITAVQLQERLTSATGLALPTSLVFDQPTPAAVARFLHHESRPRESLASSPTPTTTSSEPIAVVGIGCRFPGGVRSPEDLWDLVSAGRDVIGGFPADRGWDLARLFDTDPDHRGTSYVHEGGFLDDAAGFDAGLFGISPREALAMDPQQRVLLEVCWEAFERAGFTPAALRGSPTGVFAGVIPQQYDRLAEVAREDLEGYIYTGCTTSVLAGRIAYVFGLEGPALALDTACSSSLVALHLACQALRAGECSLALAGGVTVMATPTMFVEFSRQRALAKDGRCKGFAAAADGTGWSEGAGMLVLQRLSDARREGRTVWAVVRGSAVNEDGASNGLTAPNGPSQQRVIRQALANAQLTTGDIDAVEAHGAGTTLGDPIEANALRATYGRDRANGHPLWLGSVKSNIGHTQAAAGVAGAIKMVMALRTGVLPRTLHVDAPTPHVDWSDGAVSILTAARAWPHTDRPRRAGVSSFGAGGTNAHVIIEQADPGDARSPATPQDRRMVAWPISAKSPAALRQLATELVSYMDDNQQASAVDIGFSLASRAVFDHRAVVVADDRDELVLGLRALARDDPVSPVLRGAAACGGGKAVFVFPGQGAQWAGMANVLMDTSTVFRETAQSCADAFAEHLDWSVLDVLRGVPGAPDLARVDVVQPALFTMMVSLAAVWRSYGIEPAAVVGHSQGEIAAAAVAGALTIEDAVMIIAVRSGALVGLAGRGAMASVAVSAQALRDRLAKWEGRLDVAAVNSPASTTVGGDPPALDELIADLSREGIRHRRLPGVNNAGHSAQVESLRGMLLDALDSVRPHGSAIPFYSTVTGSRIDTTALDGDYWYRNARHPVLFEAATRALLDSGHQIFVEVSPHPLLVVAMEETIATASGPGIAVGSLHRDEDNAKRLLVSMAEAWVDGAPVTWAAQFAGTAPARLDLPTYPFQRSRYWCAEPVQAGDATSLGMTPMDHPLLGAAVPLPHSDGLLLTGRLSRSTHPWLTDHALWERPLLPGTAFVELAATAARRVACTVIEELVIETPLLLPDDGGVDLQVVVDGADESGRRTMSVYARQDHAADDQPWSRHATATLSDIAVRTDLAPAELTTWPPDDAEAVDIDGLYDDLARRGYCYGPAFRGLRGMWRRGTETFAEVAVEQVRTSGFGLHPALLDAALHPVVFDVLPHMSGAWAPFSWTGVRLPGSGASLLRVRISPTGHDEISLLAVDGAGELIVSVDSLVFRAVGPDDVRAGRAADGDSLFRVGWTAMSQPAAVGGCAAIDAGGPLVAALTAAGVDVDAVADLTTLAAAHGPDRPIAEVVLAEVSGATMDGGDLPSAVRTATHRALALVQSWLADERFDPKRLVIVTHGAIATSQDDEVCDLAGAAVWGLLRSAQSEHPGRFGIADVDGEPQSYRALCAAVSHGEPQLAIRSGVTMRPVLARVEPATGRRRPPPETAWRLDIPDPGTLDNLTFVPGEDGTEPLDVGRVRVAVRTAGLNFVDVLIAMDMFPGGRAALGREFAGTVIEVAADVAGFAVGDKVMGIVTELGSGSIGPQVTADHRLLAPVPTGWTFEQAASVPVAYLTAYYALVEVARLRPGESVLVHAATGGVGTAAVQLAQRIGATVFATARQDKWETLEAMGVSGRCTASSRTLEFCERFAEATEGRGVDVILNSLEKDFVDASLRLLPHGGRFIEIGKTDIREAGAVAADHAGVVYRAVDILAVEPETIQRMLATILDMFAEGTLRLPTITTWPVSMAVDAFRHFRDARHIGKIVLTVPPLLGGGTVLVTGGTGVLGGLVARHLLLVYGVGHVLLVGRRGVVVDGGLVGLGGSVSVVACDVGDRGALAGV
ncbi:MAG: beta-ketoacyl synthase N-terminal-like domain-containing protein, partial [Actinophytocola sp.]|uniref:beta-ketoacyl synthase N-terminal-like domain-containing protein n=1 Tax=Actinophytocola sp. TaxID=1872138 RepID=UPI003C7604A1